jgi:hypothetical protein
MSRGKTSEMIQELIDGILSYREIVAKYAAEDEARVRKQQLTPSKKMEPKDESQTAKEEVLEYPIAPKRLSTVARPWLKRDVGYVHPSTPLEFHLQEVLESTEDKDATERPWLKKKPAATPNTTAVTADESDSESSVNSSSKEDLDKHEIPRRLNFDGPVPKSERLQGGLKDRLKFWESQSPSALKTPKASPDKKAESSTLPAEKEHFVSLANQEASMKSSSSLDSVESFYNTLDGEKKVTPVSSRASTPVMHNSSFRRCDRDEEEEKDGKHEDFDAIVQFPTDFAPSDIVPEPGGRGYQRYKTNANFRNKRRPWRDDTDVFDAY